MSSFLAILMWYLKINGWQNWELGFLKRWFQELLVTGALFLLSPSQLCLEKRWESLATRSIECFVCRVAYRSVQTSYFYTSGVTFFGCFYLCKTLNLVENKCGLRTVWWPVIQSSLHQNCPYLTQEYKVQAVCWRLSWTVLIQFSLSYQKSPNEPGESRLLLVSGSLAESLSSGCMSQFAIFWLPFYNFLPILFL